MTPGRFGGFLLIAILVMAIAAPLIAGDAPILARTSLGFRFPAIERTFVLLPAVGSAGGPGKGDYEIRWAMRPPVSHDPLAIDLDARLRPPDAVHWFGTDELGRDVLSRLIHGARPSMIVALLATAVSLLLGVPAGAAAGYTGGKVDLLLSRVIEASLSFPALILLLLIAALTLHRGVPADQIVTRSLVVVGCSVGIARWGVIARYMRAEVRRLAGSECAMAARAGGASPLRILARHMVPAGIGPVAVSAAFGAGSAVIAEASLSFLGLGVQPPAPTWGQMIASSASAGTHTWWMLLFPGMMVACTVGSFNLIAEGLRRSGAD